MPSSPASCGVATVLTVEDGTLVRLAPGPAAGRSTIVPAGRLYKDGRSDRRPRRGWRDRAAAHELRRPRRRVDRPRRARRRHRRPGDRDAGRPAGRTAPAGRWPRPRAMRSLAPSTRSRGRARRDAEVVREAVRARSARRDHRGVGQEAGLHRLRRGRMSGAMIGRLNHVAIAVHDLAAASRALSRHARRHGVGAGSPSPITALRRSSSSFPTPRSS